MREHESDFITQIRMASENMDEKVKGLCERSSELQEYSRFLRQKSEEISERLQSCLNGKRAA